MPASPNPPRPLAELLAALEAAVRAGDRLRATQLEGEILQRLASEAADRAAIERQVRALLAELEWPPAPGQAKAAILGNQTPDRRCELIHIHGVKGVGGLDQTDLVRGIVPPAGGQVYPVWFGTNRNPAGAGFGGERHDRTTLGRALVLVPEAHRFGETGTNWWTRLKRFDLRDDRLRLQTVEPRERAAFFAEIAAAMRAARDEYETPQALLYLHGFNVSFEEAAIRAAQLHVDLRVPGATAFFSWPSRGSVAAYPADEASIEASEAAITAFLVDFTTNCGADRVHLIAHSMGNRGLLRALQRIAANAQTRGRVKFGQIFLAAPDVDRDLFFDLARLYPEHAERTTLYASDGDKAVHLSAKLHEAPRAGYFTPYTVAPGLDTVAVPDFDIDLLGHGYYAQAEALLYDIYDLMRHGEPPARRQRLMPTFHEGKSFWKLRR